MTNLADKAFSQVIPLQECKNYRVLKQLIMQKCYHKINFMLKPIV